MSSSLSLSRPEVFGLVIAALLSPLWFVNIGGVNLGPADLAFLAVFVSFVVRTGTMPFAPSRKTAVATLTFLAVAGLSVTWAPLPTESLLNYLQYVFIFVGVVPIVSHALQDRTTRWQVFLAIWTATNAIAVLAAIAYVTGDTSQLRNVSLWYGNQNQLYWVVAGAWVCNVAILLESSTSRGLRLGAGLLAVLEAWLVVNGRTLSAILVLILGAWSFGAWLSVSRSRRATTAFSIATLAALAVGTAVVVQYWPTVYVEGSLDVRIPQYTTALRTGLEHFPLGTGLESSEVVLASHPFSPSVHNFFLAYFLELGIVGAVSFGALLLVWVREVLVASLQYPRRLSSFEYAFVVIFFTYVFVITFQPVPVRRYWWLFFGASWGIAQSTLPSTS